MRAMLFLLRRYLWPSEGSLLTFALWVSVVGVALGIVQLMVVLSVMSGFQTLFRENYTRISSDLIVIPRGGRQFEESFRLGITGVRGVEAVTPTAIGQGMVMRGNAVGGVVFEGVEYESSKRVTPWEQIWVEKPLFAEQEKNPYWMWIGKQLADKLQVHAGDTVHVLIAEGEQKRVIPFFVSAVTKFGIYDHDLRHARIDLRVLNEVFRRADQEPMYKVKVGPGFAAEGVADNIREALGKRAVVRLWSDMNQNIFLAVEHQKKMLFLVLEIIVALAAMNVVNLLMMSSHHRRRDVAILRAMGMRFRNVLLFFVAQGAGVGLVGIFLGVGSGYLVCHVIARFQPALLSESIYNVTKLPVRIELADVALVSAAGFVLCVVFSLIPALGAALSRPVNALRYE